MQSAIRREIRQQMRQRRRSLSLEQQQYAAQQLSLQCQQLNELQHAKRVALYLSADGELDTHPLIEYCWQHNIATYLPVIHPFSRGHLLFTRYTPDTDMVYNQYHILEPRLDIRHVIPTKALDIIFTPLVAFDTTGHRLGMGGGYYDRTLTPYHQEDQGPIAIGVAHHCQHVDKLPSEAWDIPMHTIVTPNDIWRW
jgi:5-formyltetrahydrofolate cyclo-ligase